VAVVGCGTSRYVAEAVAAWREGGGFGETDAFAASEMPLGRAYDVVVAISRSGTTTEVLRLIEALSSGTEVLAITGGESTPVAKVATHNISLPFADEQAVVQTRFATSVLALWRSHFGHDIEHLAALAEERLQAPLPDGLGGYEQFVFIGQGPGVGLANEAALKLREASLSWTEAYPSMELRHGPISLLEEHSLVWSLSGLPVGLDADVRASGATLEVLRSDGDPMAELVRVHRAAIALAQLKGLDPSRPRHLARSIVL
jgi:fructoselysine-6-P-deglycase FrlB-like protein